jgi:hypothetical protein
VLQNQILGPELREPRLLDERVVGSRERANDEIDLPPEADARGFSLGTERSQ